MNINGHYLKVLRHVAAKQDIRYYLNGVLFQATQEGKFYVGTDGHRIGIFYEPWATNEACEEIEIIVPGSVLEMLRLPKMSSKVLPTILTKLNDKHWLLDPQIEPGVAFTPIDGKYPEWRKAVPKKLSGEAGDYNWEYVREFINVSRDLGNGEVPWHIKLWQNGAEAGFVTIQSERNFIGVVMPMRIGGGDFKIPAWAVTPETEKA